MSLESGQSQEFNIEPIKVTQENLGEVVSNSKQRFLDRLGDPEQTSLATLLYGLKRLGGKIKDIKV